MLVDSFKTLKENKHQTVIIISHQERIINLADELMIIADGKIKSKDTKENIMPILQQDTNNSCCAMKEVVLTNER